MNSFQQVAQMKLAYLSHKDNENSSSDDTSPENDKETPNAIETNLLHATHDSYSRFNWDEHDVGDDQSNERFDYSNPENICFNDQDSPNNYDDNERIAMRNFLEIDDHVEDLNIRETLSRESYRPQVPSPPPRKEITDCV